MGLEVFRTWAPAGPKTCGSAREVAPPSESDQPDATAPDVARAARCLPGLSSPSALPVRRSHVSSAGGSMPGYVPSSGFLTLLTASLLSVPCRLVSSGSRSWGFALQSLLPRRQPCPRYRGPCRPVVHRLLATSGLLRRLVPACTMAPAASSATESPDRKVGPPSRPCSVGRVRCVAAGCSPDGGHVALLGFSPLQGSVSRTWAPVPEATALAGRRPGSIAQTLAGLGPVSGRLLPRAS
jgi:hypothetical protein